MQDKLVVVAVQPATRLLCSSSCTFAVDILRQVAHERRARQELLLGLVEMFHSEQHDIGFTHQGRFTPETNEFGRAATDRMSYYHAVNAAGRRGCGNV